MAPQEAPELALPQEPKPMNELARLVGVFVSPKSTFADIARNPRWWAPVIVMSIFTIGFLYLFSQEVGWDTFARQQIEQRQTQNLTAEQRAFALNLYRTYGPVGSVIIGLFSPLFLALFYGLINKFMMDVILGAGLGFKKILAAVTYGLLPSSLATSILGSVVMVMDARDFDLQNPILLNASIFVPMDAARWIKVGATSFNLLTFWSMFLVAMGLAAGSRKISTGKAFGAILFPWAVGVILAVGVAAAFG
jgi:hypothetical protein